MTSLRMQADRSVVVLVDFQERLMPAIHDREKVLHRAGFLGAVARAMNVPVIATAQTPGRLGQNVPPVSAHLDEVIAKQTFGGCAGGLEGALYGHPDRPDIVIAGCEAHVCLLQTVLELLESDASGRRVWVVADACGSRHTDDRDKAMARLRSAGAEIVTAEMVAFEWLGSADNEHFKAVSKLVKEL